MAQSADVLLALVDQELDRTTQRIYTKILSAYREVPPSAAQRDRLRSSIRRELDELIQGVLGAFDNVGGVLPEGVLGFLIVDAQDERDIRTGHTDYADMWLDYLLRKPQAQP